MRSRQPTSRLTALVVHVCRSTFANLPLVNVLPIVLLSSSSLSTSACKPWEECGGNGKSGREPQQRLQAMFAGVAATLKPLVQRSLCLLPLWGNGWTKRSSPSQLSQRSQTPHSGVKR